MNTLKTAPHSKNVQALILDWAGTTVDFGSRAPLAAFQALFEKEQVPISLEQARAPMGTEKREHIKQILAMNDVLERWKCVKGETPTEADINRLYHDFIPLQIETIAMHSQLIPGWLKTFKALKEKDYKIGGNTGYSRDMCTDLIEQSRQAGYKPDSIVCATDVTKGRPFPYMAWMNAIELNVSHAHACIKIDDTLPGIEEGLAAGMWTIGVAISGNEVGLSLAQWQNLSSAEQYTMREHAYGRLQSAGAHYVIDTVAELIPCVEDIEKRLAKGEKP